MCVHECGVGGVSVTSMLLLLSYIRIYVFVSFRLYINSFTIGKLLQQKHTEMYWVGVDVDVGAGVLRVYSGVGLPFSYFV